jgi:glycosyltransferase involved in cell wall biosynthesis
LAIVASDIPEIALSQIRSGEEGLLFPVENSKAFSQVLSDLIANPEHRLKLGQAARARVLRDFTLQAIDDRYIELYRRVWGAHNQR